MKDNKKKIIGYGAPARVATITNYANITEREIPVIIDGDENESIQNLIFEKERPKEENKKKSFFHYLMISNE